MNIDRRCARLACLAVFWLAAGPARGQDPAEQPQPTLDDTIEAGDSDAETHQRMFLRWNHYEGPWITANIHGGVLYEGIGYSQDEGSEEQFTLGSEGKFRDARFMVKGKFPRSKRAVTYTSAFMYDGPSDDWFVRETGIMVEVPELHGHVFVGRTKEGFSLNKVMTGYAGWTMERATISDATIPILGDGVKWLAHIPELHLVLNLGYYLDSINARQGFSTYDNQFVLRIAWLPPFANNNRTLLHIAFNGRSGAVDEDELQIRSRPEAFPAPYFVDTGKFPATFTKMVGGEVYYRPGPWLFGSEYWLQ